MKRPTKFKCNSYDDNPRQCPTCHQQLAPQGKLCNRPAILAAFPDGECDLNEDPSFYCKDHAAEENKGGGYWGDGGEFKRNALPVSAIRNSKGNWQIRPASGHWQDAACPTPTEYEVSVKLMGGDTDEHIDKFWSTDTDSPTEAQFGLMHEARLRDYAAIQKTNHHR